MHDPKRFQTLWHDWNDNGMRAAALGGVGGALIPVQSDDTRGAVGRGRTPLPDTIRYTNVTRQAKGKGGWQGIARAQARAGPDANVGAVGKPPRIQR